MRILLGLIALVILVGCAPSGGVEVKQRPGEPDVIGVQPGDDAMEKAVAQAQATLDDFIAKLAKPEKGAEYSVKWAAPTADGSKEHIWVDNLVYRDGTFSGLLANEPMNLPGKAAGSPVSFAKAEVSDWLIFYEGGRRAGGFTVSVLQQMRDSGQP